jgi:hypothetical protein
MGITPFLFDLEEVGKLGFIGPPAPETGLYAYAFGCCCILLPLFCC